ncbi:MAG TPA: hypothetical protein VEK08_22435 [Planctomycetota bacterium]|nr:hypothetical protein [Planctomycetota bacterium]
MAEPEREYRKLPGKGRKNTFFAVAAGSVRLYVGKDHLLQVESTGWEEEYKRFYFRDIQAITLRTTARQKTIGGVWGGLGVVCVLGFLTAPTGWNTALLVFGIIFWTFFALNAFWGPTCACQLRTAVQVEDLWSLHRLKNAQRALQQIVPLIEQAQGKFEAEQLPEIVASVPQVAAPPSALGKGKELERIKHYNGRWHEVLFYFLLLFAAFNLIDLTQDNPALQIFDLIFCVGVMVGSVAAMLKQHQTDIPDGVRRVVWVTLGFICVYIWVGFVGAAIHVAVKSRGGAGDPGLPEFMQFTSLSGVDAVSVVCAAPLGIIGMLLLTNFRTHYKPQQPAPIAPQATAASLQSTPAQTAAAVVASHDTPATPPSAISSVSEDSHGDSGTPTLR